MHHPALVQSRYPTNHLLVFLQPLSQAALVELMVPVEEERSPWGHSPQARACGTAWAAHNLHVLPALHAHQELKV